MAYSFKFQELIYRGDVRKDYDVPNYLHYDGTLRSMYCRVVCYNSTTYKTLDQALRDYRRVILESGQSPRPCFFENDDYLPQSVALYNTYVKYGTTGMLKYFNKGT